MMYTRRALIEMSVGSFLSLGAILPRLVTASYRCGFGPTSQRGDRVLNWDTFVETVDQVARLNSRCKSDQDTYAMELGSLAQRLDLKDRELLSRIDRARNPSEHPSFGSMSKRETFELVLIVFEPGD